MLDETLQNVPFILKYEILKFMYFFFQFVLLYFLLMNAHQEVNDYGKKTKVAQNEKLHRFSYSKNV